MPIDGVIMNAVEDDNSVMDGVGEAPPKLAGPGETSALPPPVDAAAAGAPRSDTFAPCSVPAASEHRPDSGIELTDDECNTRTHSRFDVDERGTAKRRKFNVSPKRCCPIVMCLRPLITVSQERADSFLAVHQSTSSPGRWQSRTLTVQSGPRRPRQCLRFLPDESCKWGFLGLRR